MGGIEAQRNHIETHRKSSKIPGSRNIIQELPRNGYSKNLIEDDSEAGKASTHRSHLVGTSVDLIPEDTASRSTSWKRRARRRGAFEGPRGSRLNVREYSRTFTNIHDTFTVRKCCFCRNNTFDREYSRLFTNIHEIFTHIQEWYIS